MINGKYIILSAKSGNVRAYKLWEEIIENLARINIFTAQVGEKPIIKGTIDHTDDNYESVIKLIKGCEMGLSPDTLHSHLFSVLNKPHITIFGSSIPEYTGTSSGPNAKTNPKRIFIEPPDGVCDIRPCYKVDACSSGINCINKIPPEKVFQACCELLSVKAEFKPKIPKISGYTTCFNCIRAGIPFEQSIRSMLPVCDEVVVVDGESDDGTHEKLQELAEEHDKIQIYQREYDVNVPTMDGGQKSFASALCSGDILLQLDSDELIHEDDVEKFKKLSRDLYFSDQKILCLPIIEYWGSLEHFTHRRAIWKWRLYKGDPDLMHGIPLGDRITNEKTGEIYSKGGSDGCFPISISTNQMIQAPNFYTQEMDQMRQVAPEAFEELANKAFETLGAIEHTSWINLANKLSQQKNFWHLQWASLYGKDSDKEPNRFFPDKHWDYAFSEEEAAAVAKKLFEEGGESQDKTKGKLKVKRTPSKLLLEWFEQEKGKMEYLTKDEEIINK